ncbi:TIGR01777 family oxidoreductase [Tessaracoccus terricola]
MPSFEHLTHLPFPRQVVFEWFTRPGALQRLAPPFGGSVRREADSIEPGATAELGIGAPGSLGLMAGALAALSPLLPRPELRWVARHTEFTPGRSFADEMVSGPMRSWVHERGFDDDGAGTVMTDRVTFELPRPLAGRFAERRILSELGRIFAYRERQIMADLEFHTERDATPRTVAVTGASGMIGRQVTALLRGGGHRVLQLVRRPARRPDEISWDPDGGRVELDELAACDAVVHLAGHTIGGRFTAANKQRMLASRAAGTGTIARALATLAGDGVRRALVSASAIGYYGAQPHAQERARGQEPSPLPEVAPPGDDFLAHVCVAWEQACEPARAAGVRVANIRTGLVQSPDSGILSRFLPLYLAGVGGRLGDREWQSWVGIDDMAAIHAAAALDERYEGPINAVAPEPVTAREYAEVLGRVLYRPSAVPVPALGPRLLLGAQGARELAAADQRVEPAVLQDLGHRLRHRHLEDQLRHVLGRGV